MPFVRAGANKNYVCSFLIEQNGRIGQTPRMTVRNGRNWLGKLINLKA
jgi:hypothetical protein